MKGWLLDTNVLSELRKPRPEPNVVAFVAALPLDDRSNAEHGGLCRNTGAVARRMLRFKANPKPDVKHSGH